MSQRSEYQKIFHLSVKIAEHGFITAIAEPDKQNLSDLLRGMYWVDKYIDEAPADKKSLAQSNVETFMHKGAPFAASKESRVMEMLQKLKAIVTCKPEIRDPFFADVQNIFRSNDIMRATKRVKAFSLARKEEAIAVADMVCLFAGPVGKDKRFQNFFREMTIAFNYVDSIEDAKKDFENHEVLIPPMRMRFGLAKDACKHIVRCIAAHPQKAPLLKSLCGHLFEKYVLRKILPSRGSAQPTAQPASGNPKISAPK